MRKLIDYIREAAILECQLYAQMTLLARLDKKINALGRPRKQEKPPVLTETFSQKENGEGTFLCGIVAVISLIWMMCTGSSLSVAVFLSSLIFGVRCYVAYRRETTENVNRHNAALMQYNGAVKDDNLRVKKELVVKQSLVQQRELVKAGSNQTRNALNALYALDIIHPKYRSIVPITSFYDYFDTGICTELTGFGGAYARYEEDLRFERIYDKLDVIISKLDQVIANQRMIASLLRESNATLRRIEAQNNAMTKDVEHIKENAELTAYNTRCSAQSNAVMEHITFYRAMKYD